MIFDRGLGDNLSLHREARGRRAGPRLLLLLALLALAAGAAWYFWRHTPAGPGAREDRRAAQLRLKTEQQALAQIRSRLAARELGPARAEAYRALEQCSDPSVVADVERLLGQINLNLLLSPESMPEKVDYLVQEGDSLERIAKKFGTTVELIRQSNGLGRHVIHPGDRLRIFQAPLTLEVSKSRNDLVLKANGVFFKRYLVGTGQYGKTPAGTFVIADKIAEPPWWRPDGKMIPYGDKENVLGTRWMSIAAVGDTPSVKGYGIHGTWEPETLGKQASAGCVRLANSDVEELFLLTPVGAGVVITE